MRDEEGKRTQAGRSRKWQDCLAEVWALGSRGAPGCRGLWRYTMSHCSALSHGWTTSSLLGGFLLSTKPTALTSSGCFAQLEQGSKLVPAGLWAHSGGRQLGSIRLSIFHFPYHQQSLLLLLMGDGIRILSIAWALQSVCPHSLPPSHLLWLELMGKRRICRLPRKGCSWSYDEMDTRSQWTSDCMASVWVTCKVQLPTWGR